MKKYLFVMIGLMAVVFLSGCCNPILKLLFEEQQGNLRVLYGRNATDYFPGGGAGII